ncbi:F510_1955 family glycosylhydrolase [Neobacillus sp. BF23-41]|uniref:F510_1955 family glycosylhydrolase n=1 Tax=Neobacillus sp. BF23-41 TaxID=3240280 RepID=UPI0034E3816A
MKITMKVYLAILTGIMLILALGCTNKSQEQKPEQEKIAKVNFDIIQAKSLKVGQILGIGYPGNDFALYVATDDGLKMYNGSEWYETTTNQHDYFGFQAISAGFIASGQPQKGSGLKDPLGVIQSVDKGQTLKKLSFYNQSLFHFVGASFSGKGLYVINEEPNGKLGQGVNYSLDNGATWKKSALKDFNADSFGMIAVHPKNGNIIAMSTRSGIFYSNDNGNTMKQITDPFMVTALTFSGDSILFSSVENEKVLLKTINPATGEQKNIAFPFLDYDNPITYLAINPRDPKQIAFTTYKNDVYESIDGGMKWNNPLQNGKTELK